MTCVRKHFLKSKTYYLSVYENQLQLSEHKSMANPKYVVPFTFDQRIMWKNSDNDELCCFGILYESKIKWFEGDNTALNQLKFTLSPKIYFGNISIFYDSLQVIGQGASSKVCLVRRKSDLLTFAAKCISKKYLTLKKSADRMNRLQSEINILQRIDHPCFVKLLEIFQGENSYYLVTDLFEGDTLYNFIKSYPGDTLANDDIRNCIKRILISLEYLELMDIVHRDIKLENILLAKPNDVNSLKIIDFGLAIYQSEKHKLSVCGTPGYIAPEVLRSEESGVEYFTSKCDVFSAGVILYKLLTKKTLFRAQNTNEIMDANRKCTINYQDIEFKIQKEALSLLKLMLSSDPHQRPTAKECLKHPYFICKLQEINLLQEFQQDKPTAFSFKYAQSRQRESYSIGQEETAAMVKKCNPTQYNARIQLNKRSRSPRKYADVAFYYPSFCGDKSYDSFHSQSKELSNIDCILIDYIAGQQQDEIIEK